MIIKKDFWSLDTERKICFILSMVIEALHEQLKIRKKEVYQKCPQKSM